jgi:hypothetical protein
MKIISDSFYYNGLVGMKSTSDRWTDALRELVARAQLVDRLEAKYDLNDYQRILIHRLSESGECVVHSLDDFRVITQVLRMEGHAYALHKLDQPHVLNFQNI